VLVTLGTHLAAHKPAAIAAVRAAARATPGIEFHLSLGDAKTGRHRVDGNYQELAYVSYERDLPRYDLVVHHGGAGILYRCLNLGLPALVLPLDYDQFDHAARLQTAGLAQRLRSLDDLGRHVAASLDDAALRARCRSVQESAADACALIADTVAGRLVDAKRVG
jgi:UDP:flavonoid glycosyltransferase YjiC (YdhE family)